ncbi:MAG: hypothetical protein F9K46_10475 [Anaerolineae bacterium]|nr:MAG: hypothetical protein F9K46_10475 [Anaerolineae bacterium]
MTRLLKLTVFLMGLILLLLTLSEAFIRRSPFDDYVPIVVQPPQKDGTVEMVQAWPGRSTTLSMTSHHSRQIRVLGVFNEGQTVAYGAIKDDPSTMDYMLADAATPQGRRVINGILNGSLTISPDGKWVLYQTADAQRSFIVRQVETGQQWNISQIVQPLFVMNDGLNENVFSDDSAWLFVFVDDDGLPGTGHVMRIRLRDGLVEYLPLTASSFPGIKILGQVGERMIMSFDQHYYQLTLDQSVIELLPLDVPESTFGSGILLDEIGVLFLSQQNRSISVDITTGKVLWDVDDFIQPSWNVMDTGWMILPGHLPTAIRVHLMTGEIQTLPISGLTQPILAQTPDGAWLIYVEGRNGILEWRRMNWATQADVLIRGNMNDTDYVAISPDGHSLMLTKPDGLYQLNVKDGSLEFLLPAKDFWMLVDWMRPFTRTWRPAPLLLIALSLITISIVPRRLLQLLHRNPSSFRGH